jgi:hypothetical protein
LNFFVPGLRLLVPAEVSAGCVETNSFESL